jgi:hypothetical protein
MLTVNLNRCLYQAQNLVNVSCFTTVHDLARAISHNNVHDSAHYGSVVIAVLL